MCASVFVSSCIHRNISGCVCKKHRSFHSFCFANILLIAWPSSMSIAGEREKQKMKKNNKQNQIWIEIQLEFFRYFFVYIFLCIWCVVLVFSHLLWLLFILVMVTCRPDCFRGKSIWCRGKWILFLFCCCRWFDWRAHSAHMHKTLSPCYFRGW